MPPHDRDITEHEQWVQQDRARRNARRILGPRPAGPDQGDPVTARRALLIVGLVVGLVTLLTLALLLIPAVPGPALDPIPMF